jgi:hypothetical protein
VIHVFWWHGPDSLVVRVEPCVGVRGLISWRNAASDGQRSLCAGGHGLRNEGVLPNWSVENHTNVRVQIECNAVQKAGTFFPFRYLKKSNVPLCGCANSW